jgi:hypothetical protein
VSYPVTYADVEARWRPLEIDERAVATVLIGDLCSELDLKRPSLAGIYDDAVDPELTTLREAIVRTIAYAVKRAMRNPDTLRNTNIGADGAIGVGYDNDFEALAATSASLTKSDLASIDRAVAAATGVPYSAVRSIKLQAHPERIPPGDMSILPTA